MKRYPQQELRNGARLARPSVQTPEKPNARESMANTSVGLHRAMKGDNSIWSAAKNTKDFQYFHVDIGESRTGALCALRNDKPDRVIVRVYGTGRAKCQSFGLVRRGVKGAAAAGRSLQLVALRELSVGLLIKCDQLTI